jgi:hypothetical protein
VRTACQRTAAAQCRSHQTGVGTTEGVSHRGRLSVMVDRISSRRSGTTRGESISGTRTPAACLLRNPGAIYERQFAWDRARAQCSLPKGQRGQEGHRAGWRGWSRRACGQCTTEGESPPARSLRTPKAPPPAPRLHSTAAPSTTLPPVSLAASQLAPPVPRICWLLTVS